MPKGRTIGIDAAQAMIDRAADGARKRGVTNAFFRKGDACALPLDDGSVDVATSCFLMEWVPDPRRAVAEQARVTKSGGRVVATAGDWGTLELHPCCPSAESLWRCLGNLADPSYGAFYIDIHCGLKLLQYLKEAGLVDITVSPGRGGGTAYAGSKAMDDFASVLCPGSSLGAYFGPAFEEMARRGVFERELIRQGVRDFLEWKKGPYAVGRTGTPMTATGRKP